MAHVHGRPDNEAENLDDLLGRGPGDPDVHGHYPGEPDEAGCSLCHPKAAAKTNSQEPINQTSIRG